ncbi:hypothetical protein RZS08_15230, partial [Arthrospira platensis SPKY1]|nr:hypothetical protein [Arthrospira platensis SPKY1]
MVAFGFSDLVTMQFSIGYDPDEATYNGAYGFMLPGMTAANFGNPGGPSSGFITHSWLADDIINGETVPDGTVLYTLRFIPLVQGGCSFFHSPTVPINTEFTDVNGVVTAQFADCGNGGGMLTIRTFADQDADCEYTAGEPLLPQFAVAVASNGDTAYVYAAANDLYYYPIQINDETLTVSLVSSNGYWEGCLPFETVEITDPSENVELDLGATAIQDCKE